MMVGRKAMPIYEYQCRQCAEQFELLVLKGTEVACPSCHGADLEQLLSGFAVSSDGIRQSNALAARRAHRNSSDVKEQTIAHTEYVKKHNDE
jgi:putative FmdB family regulatory protein